MFQNLINLFFPKVCLGCKSFLLQNEAIICSSCRHEMPVTNFHLNPNNEAFQKFYGRVNVEFVTTFLFFQKKGVVQELLHNLKYRGHQEIGTLLADWYFADLETSEILKDIDEILPVPLHQKREKQRGYNQVTTFGEALSLNLKKPYNSVILKRNIYSETQVFKNLLGRNELKENIFGVTFSEKDHNKHFLIIDDIITTGATLEACAREILTIPGAKVSIVCMAMTN
jgi:ComF family protein